MMTTDFDFLQFLCFYAKIYVLLKFLREKPRIIRDFGEKGDFDEN